jgi:hypothetical protein
MAKCFSPPRPNGAAGRAAREALGLSRAKSRSLFEREMKGWALKQNNTILSYSLSYPNIAYCEPNMKKMRFQCY